MGKTDAFIAGFEKQAKKKGGFLARVEKEQKSPLRTPKKWAARGVLGLGAGGYGAYRAGQWLNPEGR